MDKIKNKKVIKAAVIFLEVLAVFLIIYLFVLPFYPRLKYQFGHRRATTGEAAQSVLIAKEQVAQFRGGLPEAEYAVSKNRLIIAKIGVNAPIVEAADEKSGLNKGAWRLPETSTPDRGGNTVITGHRFKYLPPNNLTFFLFDKLTAGDIVSVIWDEEEYYYRIRETRIVPGTELSILNPSSEPILTLFTCHPIYSTERRLVVVADMIE